MKKILIVLMAFSVLAACKDKKESPEKKTETKSTDDYRSGDDKTGNTGKGDAENKDNDNTGLSGDDNKTKDNTSLSGTGWPQNEKDSFISSCVREAMKGGRSREVASSYCQCMMEKMEAQYPDINEAARLTDEEIERVMMKYRDGCLEK
jgi:hypothetical protein